MFKLLNRRHYCLRRFAFAEKLCIFIRLAAATNIQNILGYYLTENIWSTLPERCLQSREGNLDGIIPAIQKYSLNGFNDTRFLSAHWRFGSSLNHLTMPRQIRNHIRRQCNRSQPREFERTHAASAHITVLSRKACGKRPLEAPPTQWRCYQFSREQSIHRSHTGLTREPLPWQQERTTDNVITTGSRVRQEFQAEPSPAPTSGVKRAQWGAL